MTKEQLQLCLDRLRDPNSLPLRNSPVPKNYANGKMSLVPKTEPMCCVAHCAQALGYNKDPISGYGFIREIGNSNLVETMIKLMDKEKKSLPQIADWLEINVNKEEYTNKKDVDTTSKEV